MRYLCLIYDDESTMSAMPPGACDAFMGEYFTFTDDIRKSGHYLGGEALQPVQHGDDRAGAERQDLHHRRPVRRDQGAARRLLPDRGARPERRDPGAAAIPSAPDGQRRGPADHGVRPPVADDAMTPRTRPGRETMRGGGLPLRLAPRPGHAHPPARRLRSGRGGAARRVRGGGGALAGGRRAGQSAGLAGLGRPLQGDRRAPPPGPVRRLARRGGRCGWATASRRRTSWTTTRSRTTGSASSSPAATLPCRPTRRSRSRCAKSAASPPRRSPARS